MIKYQCDICKKDSELETFIKYIDGCHRCHECIMSAIEECKHVQYRISGSFKGEVKMQKAEARCYECERYFPITVILSRPVD